MNSQASGNSWIGRFFGDNQRYRLDKRLGGGGMGDVFLATDMRLGHEVAFKLLKDTLVASEEMRKRFEREVAVSAALQSDHIVKISDCGVTPEGFPYYVMEYLRGQTLRYLMLREKQISVERTASIMTQVCKGLQLAHQGVTLQRGGEKTTEPIKVIHRDLKPDNIFLISTDFGEWVKILDFGVAKIRSESSEQTNITNITSTFIGTFHYCAPEQIQNDQNLDSRADIYSLGIILYEMLSAADPFGLNIKFPHISEASWLLAHAHEPPIPLRSQLGCEHLSLHLEAIVMKCLEKKPSDRFATVEELDRALQAAAKAFIPNTGVQSQQIIPQAQTQFFSAGSEDETRHKPVTQVEQANDETIYKPVTQVEQANDETIYKPVTHMEQTNDESLIRPPEPTPPPQTPEGTIYQPRQNTQPTIPPQTPEGTIYQPRPTQPKPEGTIYQPRQNTQPTTPPQTPEGTIYQPRQNTQPTTPSPQTPEGTIYQPRQNTQPTIPSPQTPEGTIYQPRQNTQPKPEGTIYQPRQNTQPKPEGTIYQPRQNTPTTPEQKPVDDTIYQPKQNKNLVYVLLICGLVFLMGIVGVYVYSQRRSPENLNQNTLPK